MNKSKKRWLQIVLTVLAAAWLISFLSPELAIRRYALLHFKPINTFTLDSTNGNLYETSLGHLFHVDGYMDNQTGDELGIFYLKKAGFLWFVSSVGTGP